MERKKLDEHEITKVFGADAAKCKKLIDKGYDLRTSYITIEGRPVLTISAYKFGVDPTK